MKYALISDIHGNLHAFESVLKTLKQIGYDKIVFLGDIVGYGAFPNECVELLKEVSSFNIMGNHDYAVLNPEIAFSFNEYARIAINWTRETLKKENLEFLKSFAITHKIEPDIVAVHSSFNDPLAWIYILRDVEARVQFNYFSEKIGLFGHTHIPIAYALSRDGSFDTVAPEKIEILKDTRYLINPGSVGQPRDFNPLASFAILDTEKNLIEWFRVDYPIEKARKAILEAGLPPVLGDRLLEGF